MTAAERNYSTTEKECLTVVWDVGKFRPYNEGFHFKVMTKRASLRWLMNTRNPSGKLARWALELSGYDIELVYRRGSENEALNALSRLYEEIQPEFDELVALEYEIVEDWYDKKCLVLADDPITIPGYK